MGKGIIETSPLRNLFVIDNVKSARASSWDRTGANEDHVRIDAGETYTLFDLAGPGCISHIYWTTILHPRLDLRKMVLRMYWDGQDTPSVEAPLGDFFGAGNCVIPLFTSNCLAINKGLGISFGFNCYFPMPFSDGARITLTNEGDKVFSHGYFWYHIEYEQYDAPLEDDIGRFHAQFRRECLTQSVSEDKKNVGLWEGQNLTGDDNYVILDAEGEGQFVGMVLNVDNLAGGWWGEGDDMIFIDGEPFPPRYHGTGTEEIFGGGACPNRPYAGPYTGFSTVQDKDFARLTTLYRQYIHDPVRFSKSIRVTLEHGHANNFENDYSSVAFWYQKLPAAPFPPLPPVEERLPIPDPEEEELRALVAPMQHHLFEARGDRLSAAEKKRVRYEAYAAFEDYYMGNYRRGIERFKKMERLMMLLETPKDAEDLWG